MDGIFIKTKSPDFRAAVEWLMVNSFGATPEYVDSILSWSFDDFIAHLKDDLIALWNRFTLIRSTATATIHTMPQKRSIYRRIVFASRSSMTMRNKSMRVQ